jgi:PadR family transcriptional regulator
MKKSSSAAESAPLGSFEEQVMLAVVRMGDDAYGVTVRREIESQTDRQVAMGAVYATLDRLEAKRLVASTRETVDGMSRRMFVVTPRGIGALLQTRSMRESLWAGIDLRKLGMRAT